MSGEGLECRATRVAPAILFVCQLDRSIEFYREVLLCRATIHTGDSVLLLDPDGFQLYLIARGTRADHPSGGIGLQCLIWAADSDEELRRLAGALQERGDELRPAPAAESASCPHATLMATGSSSPTRARQGCHAP